MAPPGAMTSLEVRVGCVRSEAGRLRTKLRLGGGAARETYVTISGNPYRTRRICTKGTLRHAFVSTSTKFRNARIVCEKTHATRAFRCPKTCVLSGERHR